MKLYDITENRTSHVNYNIYDIYEKHRALLTKYFLQKHSKNSEVLMSKPSNRSFAGVFP